MQLQFASWKMIIIFTRHCLAYLAGEGSKNTNPNIFLQPSPAHSFQKYVE